MRRILIIGTIALTTILPLAMANYATTAAYGASTLAEKAAADVYFQDDGLATSMTCGAPCRLQNPFVLSSGITYVLAYGAGTGQEPTSFEIIGNTSGVLWTTDFTTEPPVLGSIAGGTGAVLMTYNDTSQNGGFATVKFTAIASEAIRIEGSCGFPFSCGFLKPESYTPNLAMTSTEVFGTLPDGVEAFYYNNGFECSPAECSTGAALLNSTALDPPPGAPVLTGTAIDLVHVQLTWTVAPGATGGYNLTRCDLWGYCVRFDFGPTTFSYTDGLDTTNRTWNVTGWSLTTGDGAPSNNVTMKQADQFLFADDGPLFGPGASSLSSSLGISMPAVRFAVGSMIIMILTAGGYLVLGAMGASAGAFLGAVIDIVVGFFPPWFGFLLIAVATACVIGFYTLLSAGRQTQKDVRKGRF